MARAPAPESAVPKEYEIRVTLLETSPPIWRRLRLPAGTRLDRLHQILQESFGWDDDHLHAFRTKTDSFGDLSRGSQDSRDERTATLEDLAPRKGSRFHYEYDFGDFWQVEIRVEETRPGPGATPRVACLAGERAGPPEDVGGVWGYADLIEVLRDAEHPDHEDRVEEFGEDFDPEAFDLAALNARLRRFR